jgi:hypothetical protein
MHSHPCGSIAAIVLIAVGIALAGSPAAQAAPPLGPPVVERGHGAIFLKTADSGIDIVRMPPRPPSTGQTASSTPGVQPPQVPPPNEAAKSQGRLLKLPVKIGSQPFDSQKGWLGIRLDPLELALAKSLGLDNANGALVLDTVSGSPLSQSGIRLAMSSLP